MKVLPFQIPKPERASLIYQVDKTPVFYSNLHEHEEIQISLILEGEGDLIVGDSINHFKPNDIFIIGSRIPHLFKNEFIEGQDAFMLSLFFTKESFGKLFFDLLELRELDSIFRKIQTGIKVEDQKGEIKSLFLQLEKQSQLERFITFLNILKLVSQANTSSLSSFVYDKLYSDDEGERMSRVLNHAIASYKDEIRLSDMAQLANMTPNAFCRYFKQRTNKTFFQFLLEVRLEAACRLLHDKKEMSVAAICDSCGFKNISHFNRKFKTYTGVTPTKYRQRL